MRGTRFVACSLRGRADKVGKEEGGKERRAVTRDEGEGRGGRGQTSSGQEQLKVWDPFSFLRTMGER